MIAVVVFGLYGSATSRWGMLASDEASGIHMAVGPGEAEEQAGRAAYLHLGLLGHQYWLEPAAATAAAYGS